MLSLSIYDKFDDIVPSIDNGTIFNFYFVLGSSTNFDVELPNGDEINITVGEFILHYSFVSI